MQEQVSEFLAGASFLTVFVAQFGASFIYVWAKGFQQHNTLKYRYLMIWPFSMTMAALEYYVIAAVSVTLHPALILAMGTGGASGCNIAMYMNQRWMGEGSEQDN